MEVSVGLSYPVKSEDVDLIVPKMAKFEVESVVSCIQRNFRPEDRSRASSRFIQEFNNQLSERLKDAFGQDTGKVEEDRPELVMD